MNPRQLQIKAVTDLLQVAEASSSEQERNISVKACLHLLNELKQENSDQAEVNYLQGRAWYISASSEERDANVLHFISSALELDFEHVMAKVYLCHHLFDIADYQEFLKHYQQLNVTEFKVWRKLKFLEMKLIAKLAVDELSTAESDHFISNYENAQDSHRPKIQELFDFSYSNDSKLPAHLKVFISKWANYWSLKYADQE